MTRFEWAYPSGSEDVKEQWISGSTMILATVIMNAVYLVSETRVKVGEPGINDPGVKVVVTMLTYGMLFALQVAAYHPLDPHTRAHGGCLSPLRLSHTGTWWLRITPGLPSALQWQGVMDPSIATPVTNATVFADPRDTHLPLGGVCETQARAVLGSVRSRGDLPWSSARASAHVSIHLAHSLPLYLSSELSSCRPLHLSRSPGALGARRPGLHSRLHRLPRLCHLRHG